MVSQLSLDLDGSNWKIGDTESELSLDSDRLMGKQEILSELSLDSDRPSGKTGDTARIEP